MSKFYNKIKKFDFNLIIDKLFSSYNYLGNMISAFDFNKNKVDVSIVQKLKSEGAYFEFYDKFFDIFKYICGTIKFNKLNFCELFKKISSDETDYKTVVARSMFWIPLLKIQDKFKNVFKIKKDKMNFYKMPIDDLVNYAMNNNNYDLNLDVLQDDLMSNYVKDTLRECFLLQEEVNEFISKNTDDLYFSCYYSSLSKEEMEEFNKKFATAYNDFVSFCINVLQRLLLDKFNY